MQPLDEGRVVSEQFEYRTGDRIRVVRGHPAAPEGTEATIVSISRDSSNTIISIHIFINQEFAKTYGTSVYPHEIELVMSA